MRHLLTALSLAVFLVLGLLATTPPQSSPTANAFSSQVYAWFPDNTVRRISPGPAVSPTAAMSAGPFVQANIDSEGKRVVFWGGLDGNPHIWLYDFATGISRPLGPANTGSVEPSFDWKGRRIVFAADAPGGEAPSTQSPWRYGNLNLFVMEVNGSGLRQITRGAFQDSRPVFSPNGRDVVFRSNRGGNPPGLYIVPADGSAEPRRLLSEGGFARPWFSPDGRFIYAIFSNVDSDEHVRIWRMRIDGSAKEAVTPDGLPNSAGTFVDTDAVHLWFHSTNFLTDRHTVPYRFNLRTGELTRMMPPGFRSAGHLTHSKNGIITFDSTDPDPTGTR